MNDYNNDDEWGPTQRTMIESKIKAKWPELESTAFLSVSDLKRVVNELKTNQIELQLQNEELRKAQLELQDYKERDHHLFKDMPSACVLIDSTGLVSDVNPRFLEITGHEKGDIVDNRFEAVITKKERDKFHLHRMAILEAPARRAETIKLLTKDGTEKQVLLESGPINLGNDCKNGMINIIIELERRDKNDQSLDALLKQRQSLLRESNHRIKNNLALIDGLISVSSKKLQDPYALAILDDIRDRIQSIARIHGFFDQSDGQEKLRIKDFFDQLVDRNLFSMAMIGRNITVQKNLPDGEHSVTTGITVGFILSEMLCNCVKHAFKDKGGGTINVSVRRTSKDRYELIVKDDGDGFPEDYKDKKDSVGIELMEAMADNLQGVLEFKNDNGATAILKYRDVP